MNKALADIALRAFKTAVQTFVSVISVAQVMNLDIEALQVGAGAAAAAGLSVVWNAVEKWAGSPDDELPQWAKDRILASHLPPPPPE